MENFLHSHLLKVEFPKASSVLGPLLFAIYVNDLPTIVNSSLVLFADNTKLFRCIKSTERPVNGY